MKPRQWSRYANEMASSAYGALTAGIVISVLAASACGGEDPALGGGPAAISSENPGGHTVEVISRRYLRDSDVTFHSYAANGIVGGCSATMIGPNIAMTAAHCGFNNHTMGFLVYRNLDHRQHRVETVQCRHLYQTFADTDLLLMFCPAINGVNPGDRYGYLDPDTMRPVKGDRVYSIWKNPVDNLPPAEYMLYSDGKVVSTTAGSWTTPASHPNTAIMTNLWGRGGASGSSQINFARHRIAVGPLSVAPVGNGGPQRWSLSMYDYMTRAAVSGMANINSTELQAHGLTPATYKGKLDKNNNGVFDIQEDLERRRGEARRDHYTFSFGSQRQNALWDTFPYSAPVKFYLDQRFVHLPKAGGVGYKTALRHVRLNLRPKTTYRVSVMIYGNTTVKNGLRFSMDRKFGSFGWAPMQHKYVNISKTPVWQMVTFRLTTSSGKEHTLSINKLPQTDASLAALSLIEEGSRMDFETHDKRFHWRNDNSGARAFILPDGRGTGTNWAALARRTDTLSMGKDWPLRNRQLALVPGRSYRVCLHKRNFSRHPRSRVTGILRIKSGNSEVVYRKFDASNPAWQQVCTDNFKVPTSDNNLQLGIYANRPDQKSPSNASYLVDDLEIISK